MIELTMGHEVQDAISYELARRVATGLPTHPEWLVQARANLGRWTRRNSNAPALLRAYGEWERWLNRPLSEIIAILTSDTDEAQRLRQNSPFAGVLSPKEVWEIKQRLRRHATDTA